MFTDPAAFAGVLTINTSMSGAAISKSRSLQLNTETLPLCVHNQWTLANPDHFSPKPRKSERFTRVAFGHCACAHINWSKGQKL